MSTPEHKFGKEISDELTKAGFTVIDMEALGNGVLDRLAAYQGKAFLFETKIGSNGLTKHQEVWIKTKYKNCLPLFILTKISKCHIYIKEVKALPKNKYLLINHGAYANTVIVDFFKKELGV